MDFSFLIGLRIVIIILLTSAMMAMPATVWLLNFSERIRLAKTRHSVDVTVRFKATSNGGVVTVTPRRVRTPLGTIVFTHGETDDAMKSMLAHIVVNSVAPAEKSFSNVDCKGSFKILNKTFTDLTIERLAFNPGYDVRSDAVTAATVMNTVFNHDLLVTGNVTVCNYGIKKQTPTEGGEMNVDITFTGTEISE